MKMNIQTLAIAGVALFLLLNLAALFIGVSDTVYAVVMVAAIVMFLPVLIAEIRKK